VIIVFNSLLPRRQEKALALFDIGSQLIIGNDRPLHLIDVDYFFKFVGLKEIKELNSGHLLLQSKIGPVIVGSDDISQLCNRKEYYSIIYSIKLFNKTEDIKTLTLEKLQAQIKQQLWNMCWTFKEFNQIVLNRSKTKTKLRIVYDALAHLRGFKRLSEVLYRDPVMLSDLRITAYDRSKTNKEIFLNLKWIHDIDISFV
ncbi:unnamed protein product, partial [Wuchereria bancrofti]